MPKVSIDSTKCQGHCRCVQIAPEYFDVDDGGYGQVIREDVADKDVAEVEEAILACPESAITLSN